MSLDPLSPPLGPPMQSIKAAVTAGEHLVSLIPLLIFPEKKSLLINRLKLFCIIIDCNELVVPMYQFYRTIFMLNSTENEISTAYKN